MTTTAVTPTEIVYKQTVTGHPGPRDANNNLKIALQLNNQQWEATFLCDNEESVGGHKQRKVWFTASEDCTLHFTRESAFGIDKVVLPKDKTQSVSVADDKHNDWTECWITPGTKTAVDPHRTPPKIVVP
jgi:hypothetical protein